MAVRFRLLGTIEAGIDGRRVDLGHARQQCVLMALLVDANQVVSTDQLLERAWGDPLPRRGRDTLYSYLSRLRRVLAATDEVGIARRRGGYLLTIDEDAVDLHHFLRLLTLARATDEPEEASALLDQALTLWRGEAFARLDTPWINAVRDGLEAERTAAELDHTDLRLGRGLHGELLAGLTAQAAGRPLDERLAGQVMLALYRGGRQADALDRYHRLRHLLAEELGTDPSPPLHELYQRILTADPMLTLPETDSCARSAVVPRQLPPPPRSFVGRGQELAALDKAMNAGHDAVVISAIGGLGGIGKTWLALHWAHRNIDRFPDGQLYVNLRGFDPSGDPTPPSVAVRGFLTALGLPPASVPADLDAQVGLYRSMVAGRKMLVVLDNAADATQVTPLLPGSTTCTVLVTSRHHLSSLITTHAARPVPLDVLTDAEARQLLTSHLGRHRVAAEPRAVTELLGHCAGLPLAIGIVAARASIHPGFPLTALAGELRDRATRLDALDGGDARSSLTAVFSWSCQALSAEATAMFRLLALAPGPDVGLPAAAHLAEAAPARARVLLRELESACLVQQHVPNRWRMHDLVRLYAGGRARCDLPEAGRRTALYRLVDFYLHVSHAAERVLDPLRPPIPIGEAGAAPAPTDLWSALNWFLDEHDNLMATLDAAARYGSAHTWQLAWCMDSYHAQRGYIHDLVAAWSTGLAVADGHGPVVRALAHRRLGHAQALIGMHDEAERHLHLALDIAERADDLTGVASTHQTLGNQGILRGDHEQAERHASQALRAYRTLGNPVLEAGALNLLGWSQAKQGRFDQALANCSAALELCQRHTDTMAEAGTLDTLGYIAHHTGRHADALAHFQQALTLFRQLGCTFDEADVLDRFAHTHAAVGQLDQARGAWWSALRLYRTQRRTEDADRVRRQLNAQPVTRPSTAPR